MKKNETRYEYLYEDDSEIMVIAYGTVSRMARSCVTTFRAEGIKAGFIRPITLWPFPYDAIAQAAKKAKRMFVIEMSEGQMVEHERLAVEGKCPIEFHGRSGGGVPSEEEIMRIIKKR